MTLLPMHPDRLPPHVAAVLEELKANTEVESVWLGGSRANDRATETSDWDLYAIMVREPVETDARAEGVDVIQVGPSGYGLLEGKTLDYRYDLDWQLEAPERASYKKELEMLVAYSPEDHPRDEAILLWKR